MTIVELKDVTKEYGKGVRAVDALSIKVKKNEFFSLLGPSGCGKTTTLRMIAGFVNPDQGDIFIDGEKVNHLPPYKRKTSMVFQNYALFPHMNVYENVAFGLKMRRLQRNQVIERVRQALELVKLSGYEDRYPRQLSGGQQQRVAIARSLVINPSVILMDEPLSNLDAKLRQQMRTELKQLQEQIGTTVVYVTHDQGEALALSDRIAVLNEGRVEQVGSPVEIYQNPSSRFVAAFIGQLNIFQGKVRSILSGEIEVVTEMGFNLLVPFREGLSKNEVAFVAVRPEGINFAEGKSPFLKNTLKGRIMHVSYLGSSIQYLCDVMGKEISVLSHSRRGTPIYRPGDSVLLNFEPSECMILR